MLSWLYVKIIMMCIGFDLRRTCAEKAGMSLEKPDMLRTF
jgi:hypothetical protein